jgi:hypothetical protein
LLNKNADLKLMRRHLKPFVEMINTMNRLKHLPTKTKKECWIEVKKAYENCPETDRQGFVTDFVLGSQKKV